MNNIIYPTKLTEFIKIVKHLQKVLHSELDDRIFLNAKNIREHVIKNNRNNQLSVYDITDICIELINDLYINSSSEP